MKCFVLAFLVGFALAQGEPPEYPLGMTCSPAGDVRDGTIVAPDHPCHCKNMADPKDGCEVPTTNDSKCNQWCHEQHCGCPLTCEDTQ